MFATFMSDLCRGVVKSTRTPRQPALVRRIASHNADPNGAARGERARLPAAEAKKAKKQTASAIRKIHVLWCGACMRVPALTGSRRSRTAAPETNVVFCGQCPRKWCLDCFMDLPGTVKNRTAQWVSVVLLLYAHVAD